MRSRAALAAVLLRVTGSLAACPALQRAPPRHGSARAAVATVPTATSAEEAKGDLPYDWRDQWYSLCFEECAPAGRKPMGVSVFDEPLVLFRDGNGTLCCLEDRCPHRAAKLSEGQVVGGEIECLYHGWKFKGCGGCSCIPQLDAGPPKSATRRSYPITVREGVVWVYMGHKGPLERRPVPVSADDQDASRFDTYSFQIDLPYDSSFLVENLLDPAHIPVSHDATPGGGKKADAQPLEMEVLSVSERGVRGRFRKTRPEPASQAWTHLELEAPGIVRYGGNPRPGMTFGAALHCMPLGQGRSRLLFRIYNRLPWPLSWIVKLRTWKPAFLRHLSSCVILEQDVGLITSQEDRIARTGRSPKSDWMPLRTSDTMLVAYRQWLDRVGHGMPRFLGWARQAGHAVQYTDGAEAPIDAQHRALRSRFDRHVRHCPTCRRALRQTRRTRTLCSWLAAASGLLLAFAALTAPGCSAPRAVALVGGFLGLPLAGRAAALRLERSFYVNYERHQALH